MLPLSHVLLTVTGLLAGAATGIATAALLQGTFSTRQLILLLAAWSLVLAVYLGTAIHDTILARRTRAHPAR